MFILEILKQYTYNPSSWLIVTLGAITWLLKLGGAACFGALIGWYVYYINRYRKSDVQWSDLVTLVGIIGGSAILSIFERGTDLFGAYGIGLAIGFFSYFKMLRRLVDESKNFDADWFLDGRRMLPDGSWDVPQAGAIRVGGFGMAARPEDTPAADVDIPGVKK